MNFNVHYYDRLAVEHRQHIHEEIGRQRLLANLHHDNVVRHAAGRLGVLLVALGTRLEGLDQHSKAVAYDLGK
jgi:hypothetical protein